MSVYRRQAETPEDSNRDGMRTFNYWACCIDLPGELVQHLTDSAKQIMYRTFARHADLKPLRANDHPAMYRISASDNWAISFWRSHLPSGQRVYFFDWSRIEHVFVVAPVDLAREVARL